MKLSEQTSELFTALAKAQGEMLNLAKDSKGYGYTYTKLDNIVSMLRPILSKHGLSYIQCDKTDEQGRIGIETLVTHTSGQWLCSEVAYCVEDKLKGMNSFQVRGSSNTYLRRYSLSSVFGLATEEDLDGNAPKQNKTSSNSGNAMTTSKPTPKPPTQSGPNSNDFLNLMKSLNQEADKALLEEYRGKLSNSPLANWNGEEIQKAITDVNNRKSK